MRPSIDLVVIPRNCEHLVMPPHLQDQFYRAASRANPPHFDILSHPYSSPFPTFSLTTPGERMKMNYKDCRGKKERNSTETEDRDRYKKPGGSYLIQALCDFPGLFFIHRQELGYHIQRAHTQGVKTVLGLGKM